jgi:hypothetical protein
LKAMGTRISSSAATNFGVMPIRYA